jgi:RNA-dependent RNA polymerase
MDPAPPGLVDATSTFDKALSQPYRNSYTPKTYSELNSETCSNNGTSFGCRNMDRGFAGHQRGGHGGFRGGRGDRRNSNNSGSSSGSSGQTRPALVPRSVPQGRATPPAQINSLLSQSDLPNTQVKERSDFTLNGHQITEAYTPRLKFSTTPPRPCTSPPKTNMNTSSYGRNTPPRQLVPQRPVLRDGKSNWASQQELKIKLQGIPKAYWTKDVYVALSKYGTIVRIEMEGGTRNGAWVVFQ